MSAAQDSEQAAPAPLPGPLPGIVVREANREDVAAIRTIYAHHVLNGVATFEEVPPDETEMNRRREDILGRGLPYLVAEAQGRIAGFAYAGPFRPRSAYRHTVEDSIYVSPDAVGQGFGRALVAELVARCTRLGLRQMVAVIGDSANSASIRLHESVGFTRAAVLRGVGFKLGRWVDSVIMQLPLGPGDNRPPD